MAIRAAFGGSVRRREDPRLITGRGRYTDDLRPEGSLHAVFVRATVAHARIERIDREASVAMEGVRGVFLLADLGLEGTTARTPLAAETVRYVGEAIAVVVADTREQAADAAAACHVEYNELPAVVDPVAALDDGATLLFPDKGDNLAFEFELGEPGVLEGAEVVAHGRFVNQRLAPVPIEPNAVLAEPDGQGLKVWVASQVPFRVRSLIADSLGLDESSVRVIAPDVGGGFGAKLATYPEQVVIAAVARRLARPVAWFEDRSENLVAMTHGRAQVQEVSLGATREGKLVGMETDLLGDSGAYAGLGSTLPAITSLLVSGVYDIPAIHVRARSAFTNTTVVSAYRGAGRPEAICLVERAMDILAAELGMDPADLRRRNFIRDFPHTTAVMATYDSGDYERALDAALEAAGYTELRREQAARRERGDRLQLGIGISCYVEMTAVQQLSEGAEVSAEKDGSFVVRAGTTATGQGHETAYAQLASELLGVPIDEVQVVQADTGLVRSGDGTYGSRTMQLGGSAVRGACLELVEKARAEAARRLEADVADVDRFEGGRFGVKGVPGRSLSWAELATGGELTVVREFEQDDQTYPFGCHVAVAEVDIETGDARVIRLVAVDDCGVVLNPMLVEGQVHGGIAQALGQALFEEFVYDERGSPRTGTLTDYAVPTIGEIPPIETIQMETPTPLNPLGMKGVGESGTTGATPAAQNAVIDALAHLGVRHIDMPLHPMRVWEAIEAARRSVSRREQRLPAGHDE